MPLLVTYDPTEAVYTIRLREGAVAKSVEVGETHVVDLDDEGRVLSIEVLDPSEADLAAVAQEFGLGDAELAAIEQAVRGSVPTVAVGTSKTEATLWIPMHGPASSLAHHGTPSAPGSAFPPPREISLA